MKSTKNLFLSGLVLAIALFTSIQVAAMNKKQNDELLVAAQNDLKEIKEAEALLVAENLIKNDREIKQKIKDYRLEIAALEDLIKQLQKRTQPHIFALPPRTGSDGDQEGIANRL